MATVGVGRHMEVVPMSMAASSSLASFSTFVLDADGEEIAFKYYPQSTSPITHVDLNLNVTGDTTGINLKIRVESDNADAPSGTILGATNNAISAEFTHTAAGFTGLKALAESTGNLTINTPVWIIIYRSSGNSLSGANYIGIQGSSNSGYLGGLMRIRIYTAASWTETAAYNARFSYVVKHADESYDGMPFSAMGSSPTAATDIFGNYRHGIRMKFGSQVKVAGVVVQLAKTGTPNALVAAVFEAATLKYSNTVLAENVISTIPMPIWFSSPVLLAADTNLYVVLGQEADAGGGVLGTDGGDESNDYDARVYVWPNTYIEAALPADLRFVYGTGDNPTAYTVSDTDYPLIFPIIVDPASDFDQAAGGGRPEFRGGNL